jgi:hypothetical protein
MNVAAAVAVVVGFLLLGGVIVIALALAGSAMSLLFLDFLDLIADVWRRLRPRRPFFELEPLPTQLASDAARDGVALLLARGFVRGSLTLPELEERLDRALAARTHADLRSACDGLP